MHIFIFSLKQNVEIFNLNLLYKICLFLYRGIASIDIELTHIDINQCDSDKNDVASGLDVFRSSHRCQETTTVSIYL